MRGGGVGGELRAGRYSGLWAIVAVSKADAAAKRTPATASNAMPALLQLGLGGTVCARPGEDGWLGRRARVAAPPCAQAGKAVRDTAGSADAAAVAGVPPTGSSAAIAASAIAPHRSNR